MMHRRLGNLAGGWQRAYPAFCVAQTLYPLIWSREVKREGAVLWSATIPTGIRARLV